MTSTASETWPENGTEAVLHCPACGGSERRVLYEGLTDRVFGSAPGAWTLKQCSGCRSAYLDPRPTRDTIGLAYRIYVTHEVEDPDAFARMSPRGRLFQSSINGYLNARYGCTLPHGAWWGGPLLSLAFPLAENMDCEARHLPRPLTGNNRLLDFGCGNGKYLDQARQMGWTVTGVDLDPQAVAAAKSRGLEASTQSLADLVRAGRQFDYITACHVIEHLFDPADMLAECFKLLRPGGRLWIDTPNIEALGHHRYGQNWLHLDPPRHLTIFSPPSLENLIRAAGFHKLQRKNRSLYIIYTYPESRQLASLNRIEPATKRIRFDSEVLTDGFKEYLNPDLREALTVVCERP